MGHRSTVCQLVPIEKFVTARSKGNSSPAFVKLFFNTETLRYLKKALVNRVTRLGEFSTIGRFFTLGNVGQYRFHAYFSPEKVMY
jgi:hypothetical protein